MDFFTFQVVPKILNDNEGVQLGQREPVIFVIVVLVDKGPKGANLLPFAGVTFGVLMRNVDCAERNVRLVGYSDKTITFGAEIQWIERKATLLV